MVFTVAVGRLESAFGKMVRGWAEIAELVQELGFPATRQENIRNDVEVRSMAGSVVL